MLNDSKFIDPAFRCEIILTGTSKALYDSSAAEFERLKKIKTLGITSYINDIGWHHRHQHLIGLFRIFDKLCLSSHSNGLPKKFLWSFWVPLCFSQTGHAAISYDSEKAVLLACHLNEDFKRKFITLFTPVIKQIKPCSCCEKKCGSEKKGEIDAEAWLSDVINFNQWDEVHFWIAALKYCRNENLLGILHKQKIADKNQIGFSYPESLKILICPECEWRNIISRLSLLDYVIRDITFAGTIGIHVDIDSLINSVLEDTNFNWLFVESIETYLQDTLYEDLKSQTASVLYQRALANELIKENISLNQLFGLDSDKNLDDETLRKTLLRYKPGREVFDPAIQKSWKTWQIGLSNSEEKLPKEVECAIIGDQLLTDHIRTRVTCFLLNEENQLGLAFCYENTSHRPYAKNFIRTCKRILSNFFPNIEVNQLHRALFEGIINKKITSDPKNLILRLAELEYNQDLLRDVAGLVKRKTVVSVDGSKQIALRIGDVDVQYRRDQYELLMNMMYAALSSGSDTITESLGYSPPNYFNVILWSELIKWQSIYFGIKPSNQVLNFVKCAQDQLCKGIRKNNEQASKDLEYYCYLESLIHPSKKISLRYSAINLQVYSDEKKTENEYDVVSILLIDDKDVEVWIWGVTTNKDIKSKKKEDHAKIEKLKEHIQGQWEGDVKIVVNYVYKKGSTLYCDIDGRIEKRILTS